MSSFNKETIIACVSFFLIFFIPIFVYDFIKKKLYKKDLWHKYSIIWNFVISILLIAIGVYILYPIFQDISWNNWPWDTFREKFWADSLWYPWLVALLVGIPYFVNTLLRAIFGKIYIEFFFELFLGLFFVVLSWADIFYQVRLWNTYKWDIFWISLWIILLSIWIYYLIKYIHRLCLKKNWLILYVKHVGELKDDQLDVNRQWGSSWTFLFDSWKIIIEDDARYLNWVEWYLGYVSIIPVYINKNDFWKYFIDPYAWKKVSWNVDKKLLELNEPIYKEMIEKGILSETMPESRRKRIGINMNSLSRRRFYNWLFFLILAILLFISSLVVSRLWIFWLIILVIALPYLVNWFDWFLPNWRRKSLVKHWEKVEWNIISIDKSPISNRFSSFIWYILTVSDGNFIYKSPIIYLNNVFNIVMVGDYIPIYRDEKSVWIDVNWIRTNEEKYDVKKSVWLENFNKHHSLLLKLVKFSYYCVNVFDSLFFFVFAAILFKKNDRKK